MLFTGVYLMLFTVVYLMLFTVVYLMLFTGVYLMLFTVVYLVLFTRVLPEGVASSVAHIVARVVLLAYPNRLELLLHFGQPHRISEPWRAGHVQSPTQRLAVKQLLDDVSTVSDSLLRIKSRKMVSFHQVTQHLVLAVDPRFPGVVLERLVFRFGRRSAQQRKHDLELEIRHPRMVKTILGHCSENLRRQLLQTRTGRAELIVLSLILHGLEPLGMMLKVFVDTGDLGIRQPELDLVIGHVGQTCSQGPVGGGLRKVRGWCRRLDARACLLLLLRTAGLLFFCLSLFLKVHDECP